MSYKVYPVGLIGVIFAFCSQVNGTQSAADSEYGPCFEPPKTNKVTHPMTGDEIANRLSKRFEVTQQTRTDIRSAVDLNVISINSSDADNIHIITDYTGMGRDHIYMWYNFAPCKYTNCIALNPHRGYTSPPTNLSNEASMIVFSIVAFRNMAVFPNITTRPGRYLVAVALESSGYSFNRMSSAFDGHINITMTYKGDSTVPAPHIYQACTKRKLNPMPPVNYAEGKTKGAVAYVSNCRSQHYDRLALMKQLKNYIPIDIYGSCGNADPCRRKETGCVANQNKEYRFYLAFENSLCVDYITEKFWSRLSEKSNVLPIAMGGLTVDEYTEIAPDDSFIHVRNFTSVAELGKYLKLLMTDDERYNRYHRWREVYDMHMRPPASRYPACEVCRIANEKPHLPAEENLSANYNSPNNCATYQLL